jgi:hypothetical protein
MENKKYFFLSGFMRCGNNLLTSIINQNPEACITPNSIVPEMLYQMYKLQDTPLFKEQKDQKSFDNSLKNIMTGYYSGWKQKYIIERGPWGTPFNYEALKELGLLPSKFIFLVRPAKEILASFVKAVKPGDVTAFCKFLMDEGGPIGKSLIGYNNVLKKEKKENVLIINYHDLCSDPEKIVNKLYKFLNIPVFKKHKFTSLKQVDTTNNQTKIRTNKIEVKTYDYDLWLPKEIINEYENAIRYTRRKN